MFFNFKWRGAEVSIPMGFIPPTVFKTVLFAGTINAAYGVVDWI